MTFQADVTPLVGTHGIRIEMFSIFRLAKDSAILDQLGRECALKSIEAHACVVCVALRVICEISVNFGQSFQPGFYTSLHLAAAQWTIDDRASLSRGEKIHPRV